MIQHASGAECAVIGCHDGAGADALLQTATRKIQRGAAREITADQLRK